MEEAVQNALTNLEKNVYLQFLLIETNKLNMKKITVLLHLPLLALSACNSEPKFKVEGEVSGADGKMLYLEASGFGGHCALGFCKIEG